MPAPRDKDLTMNARLPLFLLLFHLVYRGPLQPPARA
jgi:hypothetical protein